MNAFNQSDSQETAIARDTYYLSRRGARNFTQRDVWGPREKAMDNPWHPGNEDGIVILRLAENSLLHIDMASRIKEKISCLPINHFTYSVGPRGSPRLRQALASYFKEEFGARDDISADHISITSGLAGGIDNLIFSICDDGEGILIPQPLYNGFCVDVLNRAEARLIPVLYSGIVGFSNLDDLFTPQTNRLALEAALRRAKADGVVVKALMVCNPHNPLGRCYPPETLLAFATFCGQNGLHLVSDEIYAKSVFSNPKIPRAASFTSILAIDIEAVINKSMVHVLYGASKDFCANGLRLGVVCTRNQGVTGSIRSISLLSWSPHIVQDCWADMLEDKPWLHHYMGKKACLMSENYKIISSFLRNNNIPFYEMNAGLFVWVDLRQFVLQRSKTATNAKQDPPFFSLNAAVLKARELEIAELCRQAGVIIAPGHIYLPEEYGWFRITFTVPCEALKTGLGRMKQALDAMNLEGTKAL